jgi:F0F1-type ATP synthase membrane subunit b/b'
MTSQQNKAKAMTAIDALLEGKSDAFKAVVWELARQLDWDTDDPGFLMAIATGQLEALMKLFPAQIEAAMANAVKKLEADWHQLQAKLVLSAMKSAQTAQQIDARLVEARALLDDELAKVERLMRSERTAAQQLMEQERAAVQLLMTEERSAMAQQAQDLAEQQKQVIQARTTELISQGVAASLQRSENQVNTIVATVKKRHYTEAVYVACGLAALLMASSWGIGWMSRGITDKNSTWGDIERWNRDDLKACIDAGKPTCNFHIQVPK